MIELSVTVKDSESRYKREFLVYEQCTLSEDDPHIKECIDITLKEFGKMADTIQIRISMEVTDAEFFSPITDNFSPIQTIMGADAA